MSNFNLNPKRILKHKNHVTLNDGPEMQETVQHLEKKENGEFVELKKNEVVKKYGSKKLVRDLDFSSRDGVNVDDSGLGNTPDWFQYVIPVVDWEGSESFLYELDHLYMNLFFVRELYGSEGTGREQILQLNQTENGDALKLDVLCSLDYVSDPSYDEYEKSDVEGFIEVTLDKDEQVRNGEEGREYGVSVDFKHSCFTGEEENVASGLRELLTGVALKHGYFDEKLVFSVERRDGGVWVADVLNKDFVVRFSGDGFLSDDVSAWVRELFYWDGCPLQTGVEE